MATPKRIGRYELLARLATGGMAEVFLARLRGPSGFERPVVIKRILPHLAIEADFRRMFVDEARIVSQIRHPNVVHVHELGDDGEDLFLAMEYLEGETLAAMGHKLAKAGERLPPALAAHVVAEVCAGLHAAHELRDAQGNSLGVVHRDVSPHNLFVLYTGQIKVIDFGIAKAADQSSRTATGMLKGKASYMAPEQIVAKPIDLRADVFALGIVLHELLTGRRLFDRPNDLLVYKAVCEDPIPSPTDLVPGLPSELAQICARALARNRDERYPTAAAMRRDLLAAARKYAGDELPEEALAAIQGRLFATRLKKKQDALRHQDVDEAPISFPGQWTDSEARIPAAVRTPASYPSRSSAEPPPSRRDATAAAVHSETSVPPRAPPGRARIVGIGIAAAVFLGVLGVAVLGPFGDDAAPGDEHAAKGPPEASRGGPPNAEVPSSVPSNTINQPAASGAGTGSTAASAGAAASAGPTASAEAAASADAGSPPRPTARAPSKPPPRATATPKPPGSEKPGGFRRFD